MIDVDDALGAGLWQRGLDTNRIRSSGAKAKRLPVSLEAPPVPPALLDPWSDHWADSEAHKTAVWEWFRGDPWHQADAMKTIRLMEAVKARGTSPAGLRFMAEGFRLDLQRGRALPPMFGSLDEAIDVARESCRDWTLADFQWHVAIFNRQVLPVFLHFIADDMTNDALAKVIYPVWCWSGRPHRYVTRQRWRELFRRSGFTVDGEPSPTPDRSGGPMVLYRGCADDNRFNFSWASKYSLAARYGGYRRAQDSAFSPPGEQARDIKVWVSLVPRTNLLAYSDLCNEWVVDTSQGDNSGRSLPIRLLDDPPRLTHWPRCPRGGLMTSIRRSNPDRCRDCGAIVTDAAASPFESVTDAFLGRRAAS